MSQEGGLFSGVPSVAGAVCARTLWPVTFWVEWRGVDALVEFKRAFMAEMVRSSISTLDRGGCFAIAILTPVFVLPLGFLGFLIAKHASSASADPGYMYAGPNFFARGFSFLGGSAEFCKAQN